MEKGMMRNRVAPSGKTGGGLLTYFDSTTNGGNSQVQTTQLCGGLLIMAAMVKVTEQGIDGCALPGQGMGWDIGRRREATGAPGRQGSGVARVRCLGDDRAAERAARRRLAVASEGTSDEGARDRGSSEASGQTPTGRARQSDRGAGADGRRVLPVLLAGAGARWPNPAGCVTARSRAQGVLGAGGARSGRGVLGSSTSEKRAPGRRVGAVGLRLNGRLRRKCAEWHARGVNATA